MEGDFSRIHYDPSQRYSGVLMQQGRVQLDADWNEQWILQTESLRDALRDIIGDHGGPLRDNALGFQAEDFALANGSIRFTLRPGSYYVDGIRLHLRDLHDVTAEPWQGSQGNFLVYLEVWERHVNVIEDPALREVALLEPDTATRAQVMWRVNLLRVEAVPGNGDGAPLDAADSEVRRSLIDRPRFTLAARASTVNTATDPCMLSPTAQYRGRENQLYRVEIHTNYRGAAQADGLLFTFKWSRDNGSVVFPIEQYAGPSGSATSATVEVTLTLAHLGRDARFGLKEGDVVEFLSDHVTQPSAEVHAQNAEATRRAGALGVVRGVDPETRAVRVEVYGQPPETAVMNDATQHPYLRRWDQHERPPAEPRSGSDLAAVRPLSGGAVPVRRSDLTAWIELEDGVQVCFKQPPKTEAILSAGDFWMIPARVATGDVEWPRRTETSGATTTTVHEDLDPFGIRYHYAPLAYVSIVSGATPTSVGVQRGFRQLTRM